MDTSSDAVRRLQAKGYSGNWFANRDGELECDETGKQYDPADLEIDHVLRFEGQSDPGDMTILFALRAASGAKGVYSAPYGAMMTPEDQTVIAKLPPHHADGTLGPDD